jgi:hypothetical protein
LASGQRPLLYDGSSRRYGGSRAERLIRAGVMLVDLRVVNNMTAVAIGRVGPSE